MRRRRFLSSQALAGLVLIALNAGTTSMTTVIEALSLRWINGHQPRISTSTTTSCKISTRLFQRAAFSGSPSSFQASVRAAVFQPRSSPSSTTGVLEDIQKKAKNPLGILTQVADTLRVASMHGVDIVLFPELFLSGGPRVTPSPPLDRESYELNIVGNLCQELNVACVVGYAEKQHNSELLQPKSSASRSEEDGGGNCEGMYNSLACFNADGSRAGNYRCVNTQANVPTTRTVTLDPHSSNDDVMFLAGHPLVEVMPITMRLPTRGREKLVDPSIDDDIPTLMDGGREFKFGMLCSDDALIPEHSRHLTRSGAQILLLSASFRRTQQQVPEHVIPTRSIENSLPLLFANYVEADSGAKERQELNTNPMSYIGSSAIISSNGDILVRAPETDDGDMPSDKGYLLPCEEGGALYAADIEMNDYRIGNSFPDSEDHSIIIQNSIDQWELTPRIQLELGDDDDNDKIKPKAGGASRKVRRESNGGSGFGRGEVQKLRKSNKKVKKSK